MKFLLLAACLVSVASGYKQFISIDNRNVISDDGRASSSGSGSGSGSGLSGSAFSGAGSGAGGSSWSSGASSGSWGSGAGGRGGSKGLGGGSSAAIASPVNKYKATQVVNAAPSIPFVSGGGGGLGGYAQQQQIAAPISIGGGGSLGGGLGGGLGGYSAWDSSASASAAPAGGVITAAVITKYRVQYVDVPSSGEQPQVQQIVIPARSQPLEISFESASSPINVRQTHRPGQAAAPQVSSHQEEPDILKQEIIKPVIHEVLEAIQPFRKITQEIRPVIETVNQIISRGQEQQQAAVAVAAPVSQGVIGSIAQPSASAVASNFLQKPIAFPQQSLDISIAKPQLALPQLSQVQPQAAVASNQLQQITQQLIEKARKKAAAARRARA